MLLIVQIPFADLRAFSDLHETRTSKPTWTKSNFRGFVRGFGEVESRFHRLKNPQLRLLYKREKVEKHYVNCTKRVYPVFDTSRLPSPWTRCSHVYTRLISDGRLSFRMEIGVHCEYAERPSSDRLRALNEFVLNSQLLFQERKNEKKKVYHAREFGLMGQAPSRIRSRIQEKTTLHISNIDTKDGSTDYLDFLGVSIFADFSGDILDASLLEISQILPSTARDIELAFFEDEIGKQPLGVWAIGDCSESIQKIGNNTAERQHYLDKQRRIRLHVLRFSSELRALEIALSTAASGTIKFGEGSSSFEAFEGVVQTSLDRLVETGSKSAQDLVELEIGKLANAEALFDVVDKIEENLRQLEFAKATHLTERLSEFSSQIGNMIVINNPRERLDLSTRTTKEKEMLTKNVLMMCASPKDTGAPLRLDQEARDLKEQMRLVEKSKQDIVVTHAWAVRTDQVQMEVLNNAPDILHFSGHGGTGLLCFEDKNGFVAEVSSDAVEGLVKLSDSVECLILNACYSASIASQVKAHVKAVIGCSVAIGDDAAIAFTRAFYRALRHDYPYNKAFDLALNELQLNGMGGESEKYNFVTGDA